MSRLLARRSSLRTAAGPLTPEQQTVSWQAASLLLGYPDETLLGRLDLLRRASYDLPEGVGGPLRGTVDHLGGTPLATLQADYVETFDNRRRHNLFLTYFAHGDTRKRGMALLRFKQTYLRSGFVLDADSGHGGELPDHLCVVLEYAATVDRELGRRLLLDHRAGLELLRLGLDKAGSGWAGAVTAVCATLPPLRGDEWDAVRRLAAEGPPEEEVGLMPYGAPVVEVRAERPLPVVEVGAERPLPVVEVGAERPSKPACGCSDGFETPPQAPAPQPPCGCGCSGGFETPPQAPAPQPPISTWTTEAR